jgi:hypothetical protein
MTRIPVNQAMNRRHTSSWSPVEPGLPQARYLVFPLSNLIATGQIDLGETLEESVVTKALGLGLPAERELTLWEARVILSTYGVSRRRKVHLVTYLLSV